MIDHFWEVEHLFLEEQVRGSESVLAAPSQRTKPIRLGSGVTLAAPTCGHPAPVAERVAALLRSVTVAPGFNRGEVLDQ